MKIYIGNLAWSITSESLNKILVDSGISVVSASVITKRVRGTVLSKGFAFAELASKEDQTKAIELFHDKEVEGRKLNVKPAFEHQTGQDDLQ